MNEEDFSTWIAPEPLAPGEVLPGVQAEAITLRRPDEVLTIAAQMPTDRMGMDVVREWLAANEVIDRA